ncbi:hypothetical protein ABNP39_08095 [Pantoea dispersa]|uniref:hypothetical protein n=1 Tax=Pantoea dispersa TaxID=59814 RepID=UPI0032EDD48A
MTNLTHSEARKLIDKLHHNQTKEHGISILEEKYLAALEIALTVLEKKDRGELVRVAFAGSGSLEAIKRGDEGFIWGSKEDAHPIELFARCKDVVCEKCKGTGQMDSGGTQPWGDQILVECDCVVEQQEKGNDGWIEWKGDRALPPVEVNALVEVRLRGGETIKREAKYFAWSNGVGNRSYDIIAYRVIENDGREG